MLEGPQARAMVNDGAILALWRLKLDTWEIARDLKMRESEVANRLARLLEIPS